MIIALGGAGRWVVLLYVIYTCNFAHIVFQCENYHIFWELVLNRFNVKLSVPYTKVCINFYSSNIVIFGNFEIEYDNCKIILGCRRRRAI